MGEEVKEKKPNSFVEGCRGFCTFLYNPDDHTVLGRGGESWAKIIIFYFFFYAALAGFFAVCLSVMLMTLDPLKPTVVGRTNKPKLAIPDKRLYKMDFKDETKWEEYKFGVDDLRTKYNDNKRPVDISADPNWFTWDETSLGPFCGGDTNKFVKTKTEKKGCFFMGLNRIYDHVYVESGESKHLSIKCAFDVGKAGNGNTKPPVNMTMSPEFEDQMLETYYPWKNMTYNGLQPLVAVKIVVDQALANDVPDDQLATYIKCLPYIRNPSNETDVVEVEDASPIDFEVVYPNKLG